MWQQAFTIAGALDDDLVAGAGQAVQGAVVQDGIVGEAGSFVHGPVTGDDEAGSSMAIEDEFVGVGGLLGGEPVQSQFIQDEEIKREEGSEGAICRVVDPRLDHGLEEGVGVEGRVAQGLGEEVLADAGGSDHQDPQTALFLPGRTAHPRGAPSHPASSPRLVLARQVQPRSHQTTRPAAPFLIAPTASEPPRRSAPG